MISATTETPSAYGIEGTSPTTKVLTGSLFVAPLIYLAAESTYAASGWDDATAGAIHVIGAIAYGFVILAVAARLPSSSRLAAILLVLALIGMAGNVAYGFDSVHTSYGDMKLVDRSGAANLIKPLGLAFPLSLALVAVALRGLGHRWQAATVLAAAVAWPVAHIGDIAEIAVPVSVALVAAFGSLGLAWTQRS
ncbi:MAG: hypothetical protein JWQ18_2434 [Conexibacter sp.]|nr:hypothetical protein [Conexibacter sp.]